MTVPEKQHRVLVAVFVYNEGEKFRRTLQSIPEDRSFDVLVVNDGSTDGVERIIEEFPFHAIHNATNRGLGYGFKRAIAFAREHGYEVFVPMAGNGKMTAAEVPIVVKPILEEGYDYVQGSRYLPGARRDNLPVFRNAMIVTLARILTVVTQVKVTDSTCGFRAYRLSLFDDSRIDIFQDWLDRYELENYLMFKVLTLGYRYAEVPASMVYPAGDKNYSKIVPGLGWWSMVKPFVYLTLRVKD
ncbi:MAG: glycosyltransferase family 2 protein [Deltaproteobacteria bacterium]|nr:glycosyltransferase family 2 protein [Deltaproteobacteria bacterium]